MSRKPKASPGETIAESLVTFLIATLSAIVLATTLLTAMKMSDTGEKIFSDLETEEKIVQEFLTGNDDDRDTFYDYAILKESDTEYTSVELLAIRTETNKIVAFKHS